MVSGSLSFPTDRVFCRRFKDSWQLRVQLAVGRWPLAVGRWSENSW